MTNSKHLKNRKSNFSGLINLKVIYLVQEKIWNKSRVFLHLNTIKASFTIRRWILKHIHTLILEQQLKIDCQNVMFFSPWKCSFKISKVAKYNWNKTPYNMNRSLDTVYFPIVTWPCTDQVFETHALWTHFLIFCFFSP